MPASAREHSAGGFSRAHAITLAFLLAAAVASHAHLLDLPYFWDEHGQFVPAALDILRNGWWVPHNTVPNVHPPGVMAYLAAVWAVFGYSLAATRLAMLAIAALGLYAAFLLAVRMCRGCSGLPAFPALLFLFITPLFYTQAVMAQLDMPAMTFTTLALVLFLDRRYAWCAACCTVLVLVKETGVVLPAVFGAWLMFRERRTRPALFFTLPAVALAAWLLVLKSATGHWLGDAGFAHYNVEYSLSPVRAALAFIRRLWYVFFADFRWIASAAIVLAMRRTRIFFTAEWAIAAIFGAAHILLVTLFGGAALERYLLPVFPIFYAAAGAAFTLLAKRLRWTAIAALAGGLYLGWFWNAPYPFPLENNIAVFDFVELHQAAADALERDFSGSTIATAWPLTGALTRPEFYYVHKRLRTVETSDFHVNHVVEAVRAANAGVLVLYSRTWEPRFGVLQIPLVNHILKQYYDYEPQITPEQVTEMLGLYPRYKFEQRGQWIEVYTR